MGPSPDELSLELDIQERRLLALLASPGLSKRSCDLGSEQLRLVRGYRELLSSPQGQLTAGQRMFISDSVDQFLEALEGSLYSTAVVH